MQARHRDVIIIRDVNIRSTFFASGWGTVFPPLTARASIFFGGPFTRRLLETGAYSRQAFIFTCTIFERARAPFDAQR